MLEFDILLNDVDKIVGFIKAVESIPHDVDLHYNHNIYDAKSMIILFSLDLSKKVRITIHADDEILLEKFNEWRV